MTDFLVPTKKIPWSWAETVCSCDEPRYLGFDQLHSGAKDVCLNCKKLPKWQLMVCTSCGTDFIWRFQHHATKPGGWARHRRMCWNCVCKADPAVDGDVPPVYTDPPRVARSLAEIDLGSISFDF